MNPFRVSLPASVLAASLTLPCAAVVADDDIEARMVACPTKVATGM